MEVDEIVVEGRRMLLELDGFELCAVSRVAPVPGAIREFRPDALILDVTLPDGSGDDHAVAHIGVRAGFSEGSAP